MSIEEEMKLWRQVYVASVRNGRTTSDAKYEADHALEKFKKIFDTDTRAGKGEG